MSGDRFAVWPTAKEAQPSPGAIQGEGARKWVVDRREELDWIGTDVPGWADPASVSESDGDVDDSRHPTRLKAQNDLG